MGNLFSGLEKLGLGNITDNMDVFSENNDEKLNTKETNIKKESHVDVPEKELVFDKTYHCPVCETTFKSKAVKTGKTKLERTDTDLRPKYMYVDSLKYDSIVCNKCGYSALSRFFNYITDPQTKLIKDNITPNFEGIDETVEFYTYDDAILRHQLALANAVVKKGKISERAYICLKIAWLLRGKAENLPEDEADRDAKIKDLADDEQQFLTEAYQGFISAMAKENFPICGMEKWTYIYLCADLARKAKEFQTSMKLISEILVSKEPTSKLKDKARDLRAFIKQDIENEKAE